jgi:hypothetical protein
VTITVFRTLVLVYGLTSAWYFVLPYNRHKLPENVQAILAYAGYEAVLAADSPLYYVSIALTFVACLGLLLLARWGRTALVGSAIAAIAITPFAGVSVVAPFDSFVGSIAGTLGAVLLGISFSSPIREQLSSGSALMTHEELTEARKDEPAPTPDEKIVEVFRSGDESLIPVLESVLMENDIPFSFSGETIQDLFAGGRLGGFNFALGPARLFVRERDAAHVREILYEMGIEEPEGRAEAPN